MALPKRIFLIGMPASGKTTTGKRLANLLQYPFYDLDEIIEGQENRKISDIINTDGEEHFRMVEHYALTNVIMRHEKMVLATGGGTPCYHDNLEVIKKAGITVFVDTPLDKIIHRLLQNPGRPLVKSTQKEKLQAEIEALYEKRLPFYKEAHETVQRSTPEAILKILKS